jgi:hypothetical protein
MAGIPPVVKIAYLLPISEEVQRQTLDSQVFL